MQRMSLQAKTILQHLYDNERNSPERPVRYLKWERVIPSDRMPVDATSHIDRIDKKGELLIDKRTRKDRKRSARRCCQMLARAGLVTLCWDEYRTFHPYEEYESYESDPFPLTSSDLSIKEMYDRGREFTLIKTVSLTDAGREIAKDLNVLD